MVKFTKIWRALTIGVIIAVLAIAIPVSPALAAEDITLDPDEGEIGDSFDIEGDGFDESDFEAPDYVYVDIYLTSEDGDIDDIDDVDNYEKWSDLVNERGEFSKRITIPTVLDEGDADEDVHGGTYYIYVTYEGEDDVEASDTLTVIAGEIDLDPTKGTVGSEVEIDGTGFAGREYIDVEYDGKGVDIESGDTRTESDGDFTSTILVPESTAGDHTIKVTGDEGSEAEATFTVEPEIAIGTNLGIPGDSFTVTGTGFGDEVDVDVSFCNVDFINVTDTDDDGSFTATLEVPDVEEGIYDILVEDDDGNEAELENAFTVEAATAVNILPITSAASPGHVGMSVTVSGVAFLPNSLVTITYTTEPEVVGTTTSDANGDFTATFDIPESEAGAHTITASDGTNALQVSFFMESQAPDIPPPQLPMMDSEAEALTYFNWDDVTDPSGVTYDLQVATDEEFTTSSLVLKKTGLIKSEYEITEEEKLEPTPKEEPYYWRLRAVDGASNASEWTGLGTFYVGGLGLGASLPPWIIHVWWGLGVLGAGLGCYWLGKRRAYYY